MKNKKITLTIVLLILVILLAINGLFFGFKKLITLVNTSHNLTLAIDADTKDTQAGGLIKKLLADTTSVRNEILKHTILGEKAIPASVEEIESYAFDLGLPIQITTISLLSEKDKKKDTAAKPKEEAPAPTGAENKDEPVESKPLILDIESNGDFEKLHNLLKTIESSPYIVSVPKYSLKQVRILTDPVTKRTSIVPIISNQNQALIPKDQQGIISWALVMRVELYPYES